MAEQNRDMEWVIIETGKRWLLMRKPKKRK